MVELNRSDNKKIELNLGQISRIEEEPDTVIILSSGKKIKVKDDAKDIIKKAAKHELELAQKAKNKKVSGNSFKE
ncbi:MAG: flagellar FlbD family protein [Actinomycetota bacterium]|nr:flagellar FlbD family protein [Actinomycetota bacterium]